MLLDDLVSVLVTAGVGVFNANIFASAKAGVPDGDGPFLVIALTPGTTPEWIQNQAGPSHVRPGFQIRVRATKTNDALTMAHAAYTALFSVRNQIINGKRYLSIVPLNQPNDQMGPDDDARAQIVFNGLCHRVA